MNIYYLFYKYIKDNNKYLLVSELYIFIVSEYILYILYIFKLDERCLLTKFMMNKKNIV